MVESEVNYFFASQSNVEGILILSQFGVIMKEASFRGSRSRDPQEGVLEIDLSETGRREHSVTVMHSGRPVSTVIGLAIITKTIVGRN